MPNIAETAQNPSSWLGKALGWMQSPQRTQQVQGIGKSIQSGLSNIQDADRRYQYLQSKAFSDPRNPLLVTDKNALKELTDMTMSGPLGFAPAGLTVWHGSPHKFDKFDASKIGTGEGAQAYGHGLYLAESPAVAKSYQAMSPTVEPPPLRTFRGAELDPGTPQYHAARLVDEMSLPQARKMVSGWLANADPRMAKEAEGWAQTLDLLNQAQSKADFKRLKNTGSLYKVDLPDEQIAKMLDWDKPMSQQSPAVKKAWQDTKKMLPPNAIEDLGGDLSLMYGKDVRPQDFMNTWESLGQMAGGEMALKQQGIPGIRYLDQGSRGAGSGSSNFVVFPGNENMLQILERNGNPLNQAISEFNNNLQSFIASRIK